MLNLPGNIEDLEGFQKVPYGCTIFKKDCTVGMLMGARVESLQHDDLLTRLCDRRVKRKMIKISD